jgi:hypothetical protein
MSFWNLVRNLRGRFVARRSLRRPELAGWSCRPVLEVLEDRCLPSTVTSLADSGPGSLRQAIADTAPGGTVDFDAGLAGSITLTSSPLTVAKDLTIAGPGADVITVSGNHARTVFAIASQVDAHISGLTIADGNSVSLNGGGIYNQGTLTVTQCTLSGNSVSQNSSGGGIFNLGGTLTVTNSTLSGNSAGAGGGIFNAANVGSTVTLTSSTLSGNSAGDGGGIFNQGTLSVTSSTLSGNSAPTGAGGGIFNQGGTLTVTSSTFSGNSAHASGGGNGGGGIYNSGPLTVTRSTFSGNSANAGGGIYTGFNTVTVTDSTLSGNSASGIGGGILNGSTLTLTNCTVSGNSANAGGGIRSDGGSVTIRNTILAVNTAPGSPDLSGPLNSQGHNLIGDGTGGSGFAGTDLVGTAALPIDPLLGPLQDNGGPTFTMALLAGSPALNAGDSNQLGVADQRGVFRAGGVNIGAYQASASAFVLTVPATATAGTPFDVTVKAVDTFAQTALGYTGTVTFSATDTNPAVVLPADYTFTAADAGLHEFTAGVTLVTAGSQTLTATDTTTSSITGSGTLPITAAALDHLRLTSAGTIAAGTPFDLIVTAEDRYGNTVTSYTGTVTFTTSDEDAGVVLPAAYTFTADDSGTHLFPGGATLLTTGEQTITASDDGSLIDTLTVVL